jgi:hypothetical protein
MSQKLRNLAIAMLNDQHGINKSTYHILVALLEEDGQTDILEAVRTAFQRFYLPDEDAIQLALRIVE